MLKILTFLIVGFLIYMVLFRKTRQDKSKDTKKDNEIIDTMNECPTCKTYVAKEDAILSNGKYFCSKECIK